MATVVAMKITVVMAVAEAIAITRAVNRAVERVVEKVVECCRAATTEGHSPTGISEAPLVVN